jgi:LacI family transcriptional regulator
VNRLTIAVEALRACAELGLRIADDIAVVGCDDKMFVGLLSPTLATLGVPKYDTGARSARMLLDCMSGRSGESKVLLRPDLIVRQSAPRTRDPSRTNSGGEYI